MLSKSFPHWNKSGFWGLGVALVLSLLAHLLLLGGLNLQLPSLDLPESVVKARLALPAPQPLPKISAAPARKMIKPGPKPAPQLPQPETKASGHEVETPPEPNEPNQPATNESVSPEDITPPQQEAPANSDVENGSGGVALKTPAQVEMDFDLRRSADGSTVGEAHISYTAREDGSYVLNSVTEAKGLMSLFLSGKLIQLSEGKVTAHGLQPSHFLYQFGNEANRTQRASFDWQAGELTMETSKRTSTVALPEGTQDLLSFMYQFMFVPPLEQMQLSVTNGKKLRSYAYGFEGEDVLPTKMGDLRTVHIGKSRSDSEEKTELWLAVDYHYLPVKIRKTEKDGSVIEQIATHISTSDSPSAP